MKSPIKSQLDEPKFLAAIDFIRRTGAVQIQIRYSDDEEPTIWFLVAVYKNGAFETDASSHPLRAALRLCERLADGGECTHCHRPTGLEPDSIDTMPLNNLFCWYQYDPGSQKFIRGCA